MSNLAALAGSFRRRTSKLDRVIHSGSLNPVGLEINPVRIVPVETGHVFHVSPCVFERWLEEHYAHVHDDFLYPSTAIEAPKHDHPQVLGINFN